jgi:hypothetical protein
MHLSTLPCSCKSYQVNGLEIETPHSPEFQQAAAIYQSLLERGLTPYRAEVNLFHCGLRVCGQPDLLMRCPEGKIFVVARSLF